MEKRKEYIIVNQVSPADKKVIAGIAQIYQRVKIKSWRDLEALSSKGGMFIIKDIQQLSNEILNRKSIYYIKAKDEHVKAFASYKPRSKDYLVKEYSPDNISYLSHNHYNDYIREAIYHDSLVQIEEIGVRVNNYGYGLMVVHELLTSLSELGYKTAVTEIYNVLAFRPVKCPFYGYLEKNIINNASQSFVTSFGAAQIGCYSKNLEVTVNLDGLDYIVKIQRLLFATHIETALGNIRKKLSGF